MDKPVKIILWLITISIISGWPTATFSAPFTKQTIEYNSPLTFRSSQKTEHKFIISVASTHDSQTRGLMHQTTMPDDGGMLFDFTKNSPTIHTMWMKNTPLPLDMLFITKDGTIATIIADTTPHSLTHLSSGRAVSAVLELHAGTTKELNIIVGDRVKHSIFNK